MKYEKIYMLVFDSGYLLFRVNILTLIKYLCFLRALNNSAAPETFNN